jgi:hypothetical protein
MKAVTDTDFKWETGYPDQNRPARPRTAFVIRLTWILALAAAMGLTMSALAGQSLVTTTRHALPEMVDKNQVHAYAVYLQNPQGEATGLLPHGVETIRTSLKQALPSQQAQIVDAFAGFSTQTLTTDRQSLTLPLTGVSGPAFAAFRQMELLAGSLPGSDTASGTSLVLDELAAWQLFGATDIVGFTVRIQDKPFTVAGVVRLPDRWQDRLSRQEQPEAFLAFPALVSLDPKASITSYEVRLPEPVRGMGDAWLKDALTAAGQNYQQLVQIDEDARLGLWTLLTHLTQVGSRSIQNRPLALPWWENASRAAVDLAGLLALAAVGAFLFLILALALLAALGQTADGKRSGQLLLASLAGFAAAWFWIGKTGQQVPSGLSWLGLILASLALPQVLLLLPILKDRLQAAAAHRRIWLEKIQNPGFRHRRRNDKKREQRPLAKEDTP